ncbi:MAG: YcgN family cysteine cluster protein [Proteobacteria bacterium]|nr:YcgN family cysteine cluster protein [Pseudomonadota bacterium]
MLKEPAPFWKTKSLEEMTAQEWESLCDGCGRCCLNKLEDDEGNVFYTNVACRLLDDQSCLCKSYEKRSYLVKDCLVLTPEILNRVSWLPESCAYRLLNEGKALPLWHPLISNEADTVYHARISVRGIVVPEKEVAEEELEDHIIYWNQLDSQGR